MCDAFVHNVDTSSALIELDFSIHKSKKSKIIADSDPATGMEPRTHLPNKNISCTNDLAAKLLDPSPLSVGIPTISA
jgi:hypothetical protein